MAKPKSYDEALAQVEDLKTQLSEAKEDLREFKKENKVKRNKPLEDAKLAAQLEKKEAEVEKLRTQMDELKEAAKELKPRKERQTKYEYPADCTTDKDKKKFRAAKRREAKKAAKGETAPEAEGAKPTKKVIKKKPADETKED